MSIIGEIYEGGGAKPFDWPTKGTTIEGEIVGIRSRQLPKFNTETPETWPNGEPKMTPIITVQTTLNEGDDDDGARDIYLRSNAFTAFGKALREAYKQKPSDDDLIGASLKLHFHAEQPSGKGQPRKLFRARITPRSSFDDAWADDPVDPPAAQAAAPAPQAGQPAPTVNGTSAPAAPPAPTQTEDDIPF